MDYETKVMQDRITKIEERNVLMQKMFDNMKMHTEQVQEEVLQLKDSYRKQSENIIEQVEKV